MHIIEAMALFSFDRNTRQFRLPMLWTLTFLGDVLRDQGRSKLKFQFRKIRKSKRAARSKSKTENRNSKTPKISKISKSKIQKFHFNAKIYS
jgi:hypothetical protein